MDDESNLVSNHPLVFVSVTQVWIKVLSDPAYTSALVATSRKWWTDDVVSFPTTASVAKLSTDSGKLATIGARGVGSKVVLCVAENDSAGGIDSADGSSAVRSAETDGQGIGLAVVKASSLASVVGVDSIGSFVV